MDLRSYTTVEQSRKLAGILPIESADMHYHYDNDFDELESIPTVTEEDDHFTLFPNDVRCWSLAALLDVIPCGQVNKMADSNKYEASSWNDSDFEPQMYVEGFDNSIDACYEMILKLNELKML